MDNLEQPKPLAQPLPEEPLEHKQRTGFGAGYGVADTNPNKYRHFDEDSPFYNGLKPRYILKVEAAHHRLIVEYAAQGFIPMEIARLVGYSRACVKNVLDQPWAKEYLANRMKESTKNDVQELLKAEVFPSLAYVVKVRDNDQLRSEVRLSAAQSLLDRVLGKAAQPILTGKIEPEKLTDAELELIASNGRSRNSSTDVTPTQSN